MDEGGHESPSSLSRGGEGFPLRIVNINLSSEDIFNEESENYNTIIENNFSDELNEDFNSGRISRDKPPIIEWLEIYKFVPDEVVEDMFENNRLSKENEEISWLKLYDLFDQTELREIIKRFKRNIKDNQRLKEEWNLRNDRESSILFNEMPDETRSASTQKPMTQNRNTYSRPGQITVTHITNSTTNTYSTLGNRVSIPITSAPMRTNTILPNQIVNQSINYQSINNDQINSTGVQ